MMTERFDQRIRIGIGPHRILGFWASGKNDFLHFGMEMPGIKKRNVHLSLRNDNDTLDCHVSDYNYEKRVRTEPWHSDPISINELDLKIEEYIDKLVCDYDEDDEYQELELPSYARFVDDIDWEGRKVARFDMIPMFKGINDGTFIKKKRILDGYIDGMNPGLLKTENSPIFIIPFEHNQMLKFDLNKSNPLFKEISIFEGIEFLFQYLEEQGLIEESFKRNMPSIEDIEAAIMGVISCKDENE